MFEVKITLVSKSECLLGLLVDQGELEGKKDIWIPFTRLRVGLIFLMIDFIKLSTRPTSL